jgi:hypothetical protein
MARALAGIAAALMLAAPAAAQPPKSVPFQPKTQVDNNILQVLFGERALFRLDDGGKPVLDAVEKGQLAAAHPPGAANETFKPPPAGLLAAAVDGSVEKHATFLKVWNRTGHPIEYEAIVLEMLQGDVLRPVPVATCPVAPGGVRTESWPAPIAAVGMLRFKPASKAALARCAKPAAPKTPRKGK